MNALDVSYPSILLQLKKYIAFGRTESRAFLMWFLENYLRLDEVDATDAICDGPDDKGIDGIYVDDNLEQVVILQGKLLQNENRTLGDSQLKNFIGTLAQFGSPTQIAEVAQSTGNIELRNMITDSGLAEKVQKGYAITGIFVTNAPSDENAKKYIASCSPTINLYDRQRLMDEYISSEPSSPQSAAVTFDLFGYGTIEYQVGETKAVFAPSYLTQIR